MSGMTVDRRVAGLTRMLRIRRFEEAVVGLSQSGAYIGHAHVAIGQEATCAAIAAALRPGDLMVDHHRNHGHYVARDLALMPALAEVLGRAAGTNRGRGGGAHLCAPEHGFVWSTAIVGGSIGLGAGLGFALRQLGPRGGIAVAFFGDGALEEGIAYESFNLAAVFSLPVLFVCENNSAGAIGHAAFEWPSSTLRARRLTDMPASLAIPTEIVDGADFGQVYAAAERLIAALRAGDGPAFLEARTVRWPGSKFARTQLATGVTDVAQAWSAPAASDDHAEWIRSHDPVLRLIRELITDGALDKQAVLRLDADIRSAVDEARHAAEASPPPSLAEARGSVFA